MAATWNLLLVFLLSLYTLKSMVGDFFHRMYGRPCTMDIIYPRVLFCFFSFFEKILWTKFFWIEKKKKRGILIVFFFFFFFFPSSVEAHSWSVWIYISMFFGDLWDWIYRQLLILMFWSLSRRWAVEYIAKSIRARLDDVSPACTCIREG
jgi:hypothetical protein